MTTPDPRVLPLTLPTTCPDCLGPKYANEPRCDSCTLYFSNPLERDRRTKSIGDAPPLRPEMMRKGYRIPDACRTCKQPLGRDGTASHCRPCADVKNRRDKVYRVKRRAAGWKRIA